MSVSLTTETTKPKTLHELVLDSKGSDEDIEQAKTLLDQLDKSDKAGNTPIFYAKNLKMMKFLLETIKERDEKNKEKDEKNSKNNEDYKSILSHRNNYGDNILHKLISNQECPNEVIDYYLTQVDTNLIMSQVENYNLMDETPLTGVVYRKENSTKILEKLLDFHYEACEDDEDDFVDRDLHGLTPLMHAIERNNVEAVKLLINVTPLSHKNRDNQTALGLAFAGEPSQDQLKIIKTLIDSGSKLEEVREEDIAILLQEMDVNNAAIVSEILKNYPSLETVFKSAIESNNTEKTGMAIYSLAMLSKQEELAKFF